MSKQEFLDRLKSALNGRVAPGLVVENINYYEDYINMEIRKGKTEEEVLKLLGDPRLIARTIIDTNGSEEKAQNWSANDDMAGYREKDYGRKQFLVNGRQIPGWLLTLLVILIVVLILSLIFSVLSFLAPVIIPIMVVLFLVKLFRDWLN